MDIEYYKCPIQMKWVVRSGLATLAMYNNKEEAEEHYYAAIERAQLDREYYNNAD